MKIYYIMSIVFVAIVASVLLVWVNKEPQVPAPVAIVKSYYSDLINGNLVSATKNVIYQGVPKQSLVYLYVKLTKKEKILNFNVISYGLVNSKTSIVNVNVNMLQNGKLKEVKPTLLLIRNNSGNWFVLFQQPPAIVYSPK